MALSTNFQMTFQHPERSLHSVRTNFRTVSRTFAVDEGDIVTRTKDSCLQSVRFAKRNKEATFVDLLQISHWTVLSMVSSVVQILRFTSCQRLLRHIQQTIFYHRGINFYIYNP